MNNYLNFAIIAKFNPKKIVYYLGGIGIGINIHGSRRPSLVLAIQVHQLFGHSYRQALYVLMYSKIEVPLFQDYCLKFSKVLT